MKRVINVLLILCFVQFAVDAALSASVPRTEIVGKGDYFRFSMRDSLALEASFLEVLSLTPLSIA
jgi:hypothetical protein